MPKIIFVDGNGLCCHKLSLNCGSILTSSCHCSFSVSASPKPGLRRKATLMVFVTTQLVVKQKNHHYINFYNINISDILILIPFLTVLCNRSIVDGVLPPSQKRSILVPVLKHTGLDSSDPVNFRPIANVSFLPKIIEKIAAYQLTVYLEANKMLPE